jgi:pimeloyl-ACP methyl ester carboxylesterase
MIPLQFGRRERPLYGVYHPSTAPGRAGRGMVLCGSFGQEGVRSNRPLRVLADQLARQRWHVLRFDYSGTGDSAGDDTEARVEHWLDDIAAAVEELEAMAGLRRVHLAGLRLGGALAARVAASRDDVDGLVLWDPVASGRAHLQALLPSWRPGLAGEVAGEAQGFLVAGALAEGIAGLALDPATLPARLKVLLVATSGAEPQAALRDALAPGRASFTYREVAGALPWTKANDFGAGPLPVEALKAVSDWRGTV